MFMQNQNVTYDIDITMFYVEILFLSIKVVLTKIIEKCEPSLLPYDTPFFVVINQVLFGKLVWSSRN